jgi:hypothetical protein
MFVNMKPRRVVMNGGTDCREVFENVIPEPISKDRARELRFECSPTCAESTMTPGESAYISAVMDLSGGWISVYSALCNLENHNTYYQRSVN